MRPEHVERDLRNVERVEAFGEPAIDRSEKLPGLRQAFPSRNLHCIRRRGRLSAISPNC
jgi:hypothetical protein